MSMQIVAEHAATTHPAVGAMSRGHHDNRDDRLDRAVRDERSRIETEMHDVLGHHLTLIALHAAVALDALERSPDDARPAIDTIRSAARDGLQALRDLLAVGATREAGIDPQKGPRLADLDEMVDRVRSSGLDVRLTIDGTPYDLDIAAELGAYRFIQEALTNGMRHAPGRRAEVFVSYRPRVLVVSVSTSGGSIGQATCRPGSGLGLLNMERRIASLGGEMMVEREPDGTFTVWAHLPSHSAPNARVIA
jgi:signal transduction histidine kinase